MLKRKSSRFDSKRARSTAACADLVAELKLAETGGGMQGAVEAGSQQSSRKEFQLRVTLDL